MCVMRCVLTPHGPTTTKVRQFRWPEHQEAERASGALQKLGDSLSRSLGRPGLQVLPEPQCGRDFPQDSSNLGECDLDHGHSLVSVCMRGNTARGVWAFRAENGFLTASLTPVGIRVGNGCSTN